MVNNFKGRLHYNIYLLSNVNKPEKRTRWKDKSYLFLSQFPSQREAVWRLNVIACSIQSRLWRSRRNYLQAADLVVSEFFDQGDKEKDLFKIQPLPLMDREKIDELPQLQINWIDTICAPLFTVRMNIGIFYVKHVLLN